MANKSRKFKIATGTLTLPVDISTAEDIVIQDDPGEILTVREKLNHFLNLLSVQGVIIGLVVMDTLLITFLLLMELNIIQSPPGESTRNLMRRSTSNESQSTVPHDRIDDVEHVMHVMELVLLIVFFIEIVLRVLARGVDLVYDKWQVFDCLVVVVTFALYVSLTGAVTSRRVTYSVGYLIVPRLWRIGRIHYDLTQPVIQKARALILAHRRAWRETEEQLKLSRKHVERQREQIEVLKSKLRMVQRRRDPTHSPESLSADTMTSDEEMMTDTGGPLPSTTVHLESLSFHKMRSQSLPSDSQQYFETNQSLHNDAQPYMETNQSLPNDAERYVETNQSLPRYNKPDTSVSLPGSPKSFSYLTEMSHGSSGRIPDLVEHTQEAYIYRDPSCTEALTLQALDLTGEKLIHNGRPFRAQSKSDELLQNKDLNSGKYRKNPERGGRDRTLTQYHREKSLSTGTLEGINISVLPDTQSSHTDPHQGEAHSTTLPRIHKDRNHDNKHSTNYDGKHYPKEKGDRLQLLLLESGTVPSSDYAFSNPSFSQLLSPEELAKLEKDEIERVAQIPFNQYGSISHLLKEGIPISEL